METSIVPVRPNLAPRQLEFTPEQRQIIRDTFANGASDSEFAVLMEVAKARNLNPLLKQIHFVKRWDGEKKRYVWSTQISIDGLRAVAERTSQYDGQDEPEYQYGKDGKLAACKVRVYRKGIPRAFVGVAHFAEYVQTKKDGGTTSFWANKPHIMIAKCAEALALRKAFPEDTAGLYVPEEMQADLDVGTLPPTPKPVPQLTDKLKARAAEASATVDGEVVEVLNKAKSVGAAPSDYTMPFDSKDGHWHRGDPISSLDTKHIEGLAKWKGARDDLKAACMAELARREAPEQEQEFIPGWDEQSEDGK